ncbi:hypothetical protein B0H17DRAFT_494582 [Mycena rosella]|uniref:Uncharacterized protein n=1 Tax=Mycena rosella TaxID=1033263 RepID=A0AAD7GLQ0_MYCRO|nr:hypothetical protein B0H17DRAFT_494582 [Mycena rosella]
MIPPGLTQLLKDVKKGPPDTKGYPTPASSSSSSAGSASSSAVSMLLRSLVQRSRALRASCRRGPDRGGRAPVFHVIINTPTPNLTPHPSPHPTPPATPLLAASSVRVSPTSLEPPQPPSPLFLPRSATRGMGSPVFASAVAPQSTHILPLGGRPVPPGSTLHPTAPTGSSARSIFFIHASASSHSSSRSSNSNSTSCEGEGGSENSENSESSQERDAREVERKLVERAALSVSARGRVPARGRAGSSGSARDELQKQAPTPQTQTQLQPQLQPPPPPPPPPSAPAPNPEVALAVNPEPPKPTRSASAPFLGGFLNEGSANENAHGKVKAPAEDDARSVSSLATSASIVHVRPRRRGEPQPQRSQHSRSRSRKGGTAVRSSTRSRDARGPSAHPGARRSNSNRDAAPNALGLPSNLAAAAALVERTMSTRNLRKMVVLATTSDEEEDGTEDGEGRRTRMRMRRGGVMRRGRCRVAGMASSLGSGRVEVRSPTTGPGMRRRVFKGRVEKGMRIGRTTMRTGAMGTRVPAARPPRRRRRHFNRTPPHLISLAGPCTRGATARTMSTPPPSCASCRRAPCTVRPRTSPRS